ncbi:MAG: DUF2179 domain-containing protein [Eubacteriales bacterium]|nr:DUF2179 domain-containing protein [Eubacteriales bacterium]
MPFADTDIFKYLVLPALIFLSRLLDVPISTVRIMFMSKGKKFLSPLLGFFESLIWVFIISQIMQHLDNALTYIAYAGGFAIGCYVGMILEEKLALGTYMVRIILSDDTNDIRTKLIEEGFGVTKIIGIGRNGPVSVINTIIKRRDVERVVSIIHNSDKKAFYSIEETRSVSAGVFPSRRAIKSEVNEMVAGNKSKLFSAFRNHK